MKKVFLTIFFVTIILSPCFSQAANVDTRLNGIWVGTIGGIEVEFRFNNGNFESATNGNTDTRGTYTTINGEITLKPAHVHGSSFNATAGASFLESKWYTINEYIVAIRDIFLRLGFAESYINEITYFMISPPSSSYSVDANTLILTSNINGNKTVQILTKR